MTGDNFSGEWVAQAFRAAGVAYRRADRAKSELYLEGLSAFTRGLVEIPDMPVLARELRLLERRTARSGRDSVDHGPSGSDDHANVVFGCLWLLARRGNAVIQGPIIYRGGENSRDLVGGYSAWREYDELVRKHGASNQYG